MKSYSRYSLVVLVCGVGLTLPVTAFASEGIQSPPAPEPPPPISSAAEAVRVPAAPLPIPALPYKDDENLVVPTSGAHQ